MGTGNGANRMPGCGSSCEAELNRTNQTLSRPRCETFTPSSTQFSASCHNPPDPPRTGASCAIPGQNEGSTSGASRKSRNNSAVDRETVQALHPKSRTSPASNPKKRTRINFKYALIFGLPKQFQLCMRNGPKISPVNCAACCRPFNRAVDSHSSSSDNPLKFPASTRSVAIGCPMVGTNSMLDE
jgi:hypothetical protein